MKIGLYHLSRDKNGLFIQLEERPMWAEFLEQAGEWLVSKNEWIHCDQPEWLSKVRWSDELDADGWTDSNLGYQLYKFAGWVCNGFGTWRQRTAVGRLPVSREWVAEHFPDADDLFTDGVDNPGGVP